MAFLLCLFPKFCSPVAFHNYLLFYGVSSTASFLCCLFNTLAFPSHNLVYNSVPLCITFQFRLILRFSYQFFSLKKKKTSHRTKKSTWFTYLQSWQPKESHSPNGLIELSKLSFFLFLGVVAVLAGLRVGQRVGGVRAVLLAGHDGGAGGQGSGEFARAAGAGWIGRGARRSGLLPDNVAGLALLTRATATK